MGVKNQQRKLVNIIFHGVGGDYLTISNDAHKELLDFLDQHRADYWVDSYINIMQQFANPLELCPEESLNQKRNLEHLTYPEDLPLKHFLLSVLHQ